MGGKVNLALNILAFPSAVSPEIISEILRGAMDKVNEAGGIIAGGHTISTDHIIYGLSVVGTVTKEQLKTNGGAKAGQKIILTKKIGTGIYAKEINLHPERNDCQEVVTSMTTLNKYASEVVSRYSIQAVTDVTGFGLLGHLSEVLGGSNISAHLYMEKVPLFARTREFAIPYANGGMKRNIKHFGKQVEFVGATNTEENRNILFDPQTSGGLLIFVDPQDAENLLTDLHQNGVTQAQIIGETVERCEKLIKVFG